MQPRCPATAVLPDGHLPGERPRDFALLRLRDGDRPHPGCSRFDVIKTHFCPCTLHVLRSALSPQSVIVLYAFSRPFLLNEQIQVSENQTFYKQHILKVIMRVPLMCFIASIFSFIFFQLVSRKLYCAFTPNYCSFTLSSQPSVRRWWHHFVFQSYVLLAIVIFLPYISQCLKWCRSKAIGRHQTWCWKLIKAILAVIADDDDDVLVTKLKIVNRTLLPFQARWRRLRTPWCSTPICPTNPSAKTEWRLSATESMPSWQLFSSWTYGLWN